MSRFPDDIPQELIFQTYEIGQELDGQTYDTARVEKNLELLALALEKGDLSGILTVDANLAGGVRFDGNLIGAATKFGDNYEARVFNFSVEDTPINLDSVDIAAVGSFSDPLAAAMAVLVSFFDWCTMPELD